MRSAQNYSTKKVDSLADLKKVDIECAPKDVSQQGPASLYSKLFLHRTAIVLIILVTVTIAATATVLFTGKRVEAPAAMDVQNNSVGGLSVATSQLEVLIIQDLTDNSTSEVQSGVQRSALVQWLGFPSALDFEPYNKSYPLVQLEVLWQLPSHISARRNSEDTYDEDEEFISVTLDYNVTMLEKCLRSGSKSCFPQVDSTKRSQSRRKIIVTYPTLVSNVPLTFACSRRTPQTSLTSPTPVEQGAFSFSAWIFLQSY